VHSRLVFGTDYHSHLGTRRGGLAVMNGGRVTRVIHDISNTQFRSKFDNDLARFRGGCASSFFSILTISLSR
jgi:amidophosphoribosyltransferase